MVNFFNIGYLVIVFSLGILVYFVILVNLVDLVSLVILVIMVNLVCVQNLVILVNMVIQMNLMILLNIAKLVIFCETWDPGEFGNSGDFYEPADEFKKMGNSDDF